VPNSKFLQHSAHLCEKMIIFAPETFQLFQIMTAITIERETNSYWQLIRDASAEIKLALIARLSDALVNETKRVRGNTALASLIADIEANAPKDVPMTDEEIAAEVNAVRFGR
jgi:hypothetical protein